MESSGSVDRTHVDHSPKDSPTSAGPGSRDSGKDTPTSPAEQLPKSRNNNACDACRARKVKCHYKTGEAKCDGCIFLGIICAHHRPRRRRGPTNKHAQRALELSKAQTQGDSGRPSNAVSLAEHHSPMSEEGYDQLLPWSVKTTERTTSPTVAAVDKDIRGRWLEELATREVIGVIISDWFEHIFPICPVVHRRRFLTRLRRGDAETQPAFCALVTLLCAIAIKVMRRNEYGPLTVGQCLDMIQRHNLLWRERASSVPYTLDWCTAMYLFSSTRTALFRLKVGDVGSFDALAESAAGVRYLAHYGMDSLDRTEKELLKRVFWMHFSTSCTIDIFGRLTTSVLTPQEQVSQLRALHLTDHQLDPDAYSEDKSLPYWHGDDTSYIPGMTYIVDVFLVWHESQTTQYQPPRSNEELLQLYLGKVQHVINNLPVELRWRGRLSRPSGVTEGHDAQLANLYITSFHVRSNLVQRFGGHGLASGEELNRIMDDLLEVLYNLPQAALATNDTVIVPKVRDIGAVYLEHLRAKEGRISVSDGKIDQLLRKLEDLDPGTKSVMYLSGG